MSVIRTIQGKPGGGAGGLRRLLVASALCFVQGPAAWAHDLHFPDSEHATLIVEVGSDLTFPDGFDRIEVSSEDGDGHDAFSWVVARPLTAADDFAYPSRVRVLERAGLHNGVYRIVVSALKDGCTIVSRPFRVEMHEGEIRIHAQLLPKPYPEILWGRPAPIVHGTRLGPAQLDAIARTEHKPVVPGTFIYLPGEGALLPEGSHELSVTFVPDDTDSFHITTKSVQIFVASSPGGLIDITDADADGFPFLLEEAFLMDPENPDLGDAPILDVQEVAGKRYLHCTFRSQSGGTGSNPYISTNFEYAAQVSENFSRWSHAASDIVLKDRFSIPGRGTVQVFRSTRPVEPGRREYIRVRVLRR